MISVGGAGVSFGGVDHKGSAQLSTRLGFGAVAGTQIEIEGELAAPIRALRQSDPRPQPEAPQTVENSTALTFPLKINDRRLR